VNEFRDAMRDAGITVVTTRKILSTLAQLLQHAIGPEHGRQQRRAWRQGNWPARPKARARSCAHEGSHARPAQRRRPGLPRKLALPARQRVRAGELHALRWRHLDFAKGEVKIGDAGGRLW